MLKVKKLLFGILATGFCDPVIAAEKIDSIFERHTRQENYVKESFSFEPYGLVNRHNYLLGPARLSLEFISTGSRENSHHFHLDIKHLSNNVEWKRIGYITGEVIYGECPGRYSD